MTTSHSAHPESTSEIGQPFNPHELQQFDKDDAAAGSTIGKLLTLFFLYTVLAMIGVSGLTWYCIQAATAP